MQHNSRRVKVHESHTCLFWCRVSRNYPAHCLTGRRPIVMMPFISHRGPKVKIIDHSSFQIGGHINLKSS